jgi:hypothetical protein
MVIGHQGVIEVAFEVVYCYRQLESRCKLKR